MQTFKEYINEISGANVSELDLHRELVKSGWTIEKSGGSGGHTKYVHPESQTPAMVPRHRKKINPLIVQNIRKQIKSVKKF